MKLQCKICKSFDLKCEENQIICNDCGCKYSIEEAKNLIKQSDETKSQENIETVKSKEDPNNGLTPFFLTTAIIVAFIWFILAIYYFLSK